MIINDLFTEQKPSVAEDASSAYIFIQGDFDGDTASTGPTQGNQRDQQTTPIQFTHGRMSNVRRLSGPPPEGGKTIKQARIPLTLVAGNQKFSTTGVDLQLTVAPNGYVTKGEFGRVIGIAVVKIMQPESVAEDLTRRGFLRGLGAAALAGAAGDALAGTDDKAFAEKVLAAHNAMQNPRYNKEHKDLGLYIVRGMHGAAAENNKRWYEKTAKLLQKYGVKINEGMAEDDDAVAAFLARGGEIQRGKPARPRKSERWQGSAHIGAAGGRGTKGQVSGLAANTGKSGKPVVTAEQGVAENMNDDELAALAKKVSPDAYIRVNSKEVQRPANTGGPYTAPVQDAAKMQRDLTVRYPNIDELVAAAEQRRDPAYNYAEGDAYYRGRDAEQKYQKLRQIQRVIQGLNESQAQANDPKTKQLGTGTGRVNPVTGRPWTPRELKAKYAAPAMLEPAPEPNLPAPPPAPEPKSKDSTDPFKAKRDAAARAAQLAMGDVVAPALTPPTTVSATNTPSGPPGFNASNLAQLPGMNRFTQQPLITPKPAANYGPGPAGYKSTNVNVRPTATKSTSVASAAAKPSAQQQQEYYKSLGLTENLIWSKNFDPARSLYRQINQDR